jgi:Ribosomal protein S25
MGGKGKKGISQLAKRQEKAIKEASQRKEKPKIPEKKETQRPISISSESILESIKKELKNFDYLSAWVVSSKYNITQGESKRILQRLESEGLIKPAYKISRNPIYSILRA